MKYSNTIIVGSGPAAMGAILGLKKIKPLILDVGFEHNVNNSFSNKSLQINKNYKINSQQNKLLLL